jgi:hypothetical protein
MKHVKLFEAWDQEMTEQTPAQLLVTGDWTGILKNPDPFASSFEGEFIAPATYIIRYLPAGSPIPSGYEMDAEEPLEDVQDIFDAAFTGDQNGVTVAPHDYDYLKKDNSVFAEDIRKGVSRIFIDASLDPADLESQLRDTADRVWGVESDADLYSVSDYEPDIFEPEYLQAAMEGKPFPRQIVFQ